MLTKIINIYTDGSCHTQHCAGAWVSIIFIDEEKIVLSGTNQNTTHNRMEILAVIKALEYVESIAIHSRITVVTDSQYVVGLPTRAAKIITQNYHTKKGITIGNADLVERLLALLSVMSISFIKIKAHQKKTTDINFNIEADMLSRNMVRQMIKQLPIINNK